MNLIQRSICIFALTIVILYILLRNSGDNELEQVTSEEYIRLTEELTRLERLLELENKNIDEIRLKLASLEGKKPQFIPSENAKGPWDKPIAVLIFTCKRADAVRVVLNKLLRIRPSSELFHLIVSQDCDDNSVKEAVDEFGSNVTYIKHSSPKHAKIEIPSSQTRYKTYFYIARHYKLGLDYVFNTKNYDSVIIVEDDLDISPDFFLYFSGTRWLLDADPTLYCISAWNDNGKAQLIDMEAHDLLYRSDFFPGLGWMMTNKLWQELGPIWPTGFWDDWIRDPARRKDRQCIRPEISRTAMTDFGKIGASEGLFFAKYLKKIVLNNKTVDFTMMDHTNLLPDKYLQTFISKVYSLPTIKVNEFLLLNEKEKEFRLEYSSMTEYTEYTRKIKIMGDTKAGVPRTAYHGIVTAYVRGKRLYLAPANRAFKGYDSKWEAPQDILDGL
ncbi:unnamed protein product [Bursaphelenchus okinawaensis]|uniref:Alpha-1,3-mannosyl-glycoprotein 2-beta-N-acetylglucosaminyltransferase n=1 Tax=Bursaphelenchus okinawaensis TaxID=465554 RepID=A0A811LPA0_9BILA|nr:unnamed protein product [Bursaphelenchus okinawaensis]CAG9127049.1 unnamed protein product [Bursaphelenchus okinawaensis]